MSAVCWSSTSFQSGFYFSIFKVSIFQSTSHSYEKPFINQSDKQKGKEIFKHVQFKPVAQRKIVQRNKKFIIAKGDTNILKLFVQFA